MVSELFIAWSSFKILANFSQPEINIFFSGFFSEISIQYSADIFNVFAEPIVNSAFRCLHSCTLKVYGSLR